MCLIGIAWKMHPDFPLIAAANRDEYHARPTAPSAWWRDARQVLAGRDLQSGGTWMGITCSGRFAALTNVRDPAGQLQEAPTRGALVADFLCGTAAPAANATRLATQTGHYNGFNLLTGTAEALWYTGNRGATPHALAPGIYGLSNALLDTPWPKVTALKSALAAALGGMMAKEPLQSRVSGLMPLLFQALGDARPAPDALLPHTGVPLERERALSSALIVAPGYGTRASTVLCMTRDGSVTWEERSLTPDGAVAHTVREQFNLG